MNMIEQIYLNYLNNHNSIRKKEVEFKNLFNKLNMKEKVSLILSYEKSNIILLLEKLFNKNYVLNHDDIDIFGLVFEDVLFVDDEEKTLGDIFEIIKEQKKERNQDIKDFILYSDNESCNLFRFMLVNLLSTVKENY